MLCAWCGSPVVKLGAHNVVFWYPHGMDLQAFRALRNELVKISRVRTPVKMYRRAWQGLEEARRSLKGGTEVPTAGFSLHGTEGLPGVLEDGRLYASKLGPTGQHGGGVYWWKGFPREGYLQGPSHEGILSDLATLPDKKPMLSNIYSGHHNRDALRTGPGDYKLRPKDTAVIDTATRVQDKTLAPVRADAATQHARVIDSAIWDKAMKDFKRTNLRRAGKEVPGHDATEAELVRLYEQRKKGLLG